MTQKKPRADTKEAAAQQASSSHQEVGTTAAAEGPKRFTLAPNVQLLGEMQGTGFEDRQWLIQHGDEFLQVTELLYRILEQATGERTLEEIAAGVTEATDWIVSPDNVRQLIQTNLIPMGVISTDDNSAVAYDMAGEEDWSRSVLGVTLRLKAIGPPTIDPITKVLQVLYAPPVLVPVLAVIALAHGWVYLVHGGVWRGVYETIYNPALTLLIGAILVVSATFHEFGHASALRYGGGKTRAIGVGMYLTDLAFYTDVTDSYRLGRWARVRTGLGGFYFDLIFALGLMALYLATGQEILLFIVFVINMELLFQLIPFVRLDGYWILADLTGVPDFFSQMGPFLRSVLPIGGWRGSELPNLKPWVKAVFAVYVLLVVPVLALLLFFLITYTPSIMVAIWDSSLTQAGRFSVALSEGSVLGMAAASFQYALLAIEIVGILYLFYALGRIALKALWKWLKPRLRTA